MCRVHGARYPTIDAQQYKDRRQQHSHFTQPPCSMKEVPGRTMSKFASSILAPFLLASAQLTGIAATLNVNNPVGGISVQVTTGARLQVHGQGIKRKATKDDIKITRDRDVIFVRCEPQDQEPIDLEILLPFDYTLDASTEHGSITVAGMLRRANLQTKSGGLAISAPWRATRFRLDAEKKPPKITLPPGFKFTQRKIEVTEKRTIWTLRDALADWDVAYGQVRIKADSPVEIKLTDFEIPEDSPVKFPWQAPRILNAILEAPAKLPARPAAKLPETGKPIAPAEDPVFRSDVRMVSLVVSAYGAGGRPIGDLVPEDFEIIEDGAPQKVTFAGSDDIPFNLAILLDLSGSTKPDRAAMKEAARGFISLASPNDRIAVYALAGGVFHVVSRLTDAREELLQTIERLPEVSGASPLYDMIALAYAEDLQSRPGQRNALIIISDGIDNRVSKQELPSRVSIRKLTRAAAEMNALIYPVFLRSGERFGRGWSQKGRLHMQQLAQATGGKLFPALSIRDLQPVFPQVGQELRSVYGVAYYPENQNFDGVWRDLQVKVNRPGVTVRARTGYFAR